MKATQDDSIFKVFYLDIGLLIYFLGTDWNILNEKFEEFFVTKGLLAEQFIAQHLAYIDGGHEEPSLNYWLRDKATAKSEIDFLIQHKGSIWPIEVKAESGGRLKSLLIFSHLKSCSNAVKFSLEPLAEQRIKQSVVIGKSTEPVELDLKTIPLYLVESLHQLLF